MSMIDPPIRLADKAKLRDVQKNKLDILRYLNSIASAIADGNLEHPANAVALVTMGPDGPNVYYQGFTSWDELKDAATFLKDGIWNAYWNARNGVAEDEDEIDNAPTRGAQHRWKQKNDYNRMQEAKKLKHAKENPWCCEWCERRFTTERGTKIHERSCYNRKKAARA